MKFVKPSKIK